MEISTCVKYVGVNDHQVDLFGYSRYSLKTYIAESRHDIYADGQLRLVIETEASKKDVAKYLNQQKKEAEAPINSAFADAFAKLNLDKKK